MACDVLIIGAGPAGLSAGLYAARSCLKTVIAERTAVGGQAATTWEIENYPGAPAETTGPALTARMREQCEAFGVEFMTGKVKGLIREGDVFNVTVGRKTVQAKAVIIAAGASPKLLGCPGEKTYRGRGVSYCATCDANFYRDCEAAVIGGGDTAVEEALYLTRFAKKVTLIHRRDAFRATEILAERAQAHPQIEIIWDTVVDEIAGGSAVEKLLLHNVKTEEKSELAVDGVFIFVGQEPNAAVFSEIVALDDRGYIITDENMATNQPGIFAAGDIRPKMLRQIVTAVSDGAVAATAARHYIEQL